MALTYWAAVSLAKMCFTAFARWEVDGAEAVPPKGPLIVVANHLSNSDPPMLVASMPRKLNFLGKRSLFSNPLGAWFLDAVGVHPIDRERPGIDALRWELDLLQQDRAVVVFPEGVRSQSGGMSRGMPGVAYVAARSQAPILPVGITGTENIPSYWRIAFPLCHVKIKIGEPFSLPVLEGRLSRPVLEGLTDMIMGRVAALLPNSYKGYYATPEKAGSR